MCYISHGETAKLLYRWRFLFACAGWLLPELAVTVRGWQTIYTCVLGKPFDEMRLQSSSFRDPFCYQNCLGWRATMNLFIPICMISLHIWFISQPITVNIYKYSSTCLQSHLASIIAGSMEKTLRGQNKGTATKHRCRDLKPCHSCMCVDGVLAAWTGTKAGVRCCFFNTRRKYRWDSPRVVSAIEAGPTEQVLVDQPTRTRSVPQKETPQLFLPSFLYDSPERDIQIAPTAARA